MKPLRVHNRLWFRLTLWFAVILLAFFVLVSLIYTMLDQAVLSQMAPAKRQIFLAVSDQLAALDPVSERATLAIMIGVAVPLSLMAGALVAIRITRPVSQIGQTAQRVVGGELSARVPRSAQHGGEIAALVSNVNQLFETVEASDARLKKDAAAIAHELRTPLAALQMKLHGMIDGVVETSEPELHRLLTQSQILARVVDDLRTLSLASHGELTLVKSRTDLLRLAHSAVDMHGDALKAAGMAVTVTGPPTDLDVDADRLRQALSNLIENALRYAAEGGALDVRLHPGQSTCDIEIADRGPGIGLSFRSVMFEPFEREETSRSRAHGGSGLGLSIVKAIAEAHGGSVRATPRDGGGMSVVLSLPREKT